MATTKTVKKTDTKILTKAQFNRLGKARQKMLIAQDVLDQLKKGRFLANTGRYIDYIAFKGDYYFNADIKKHFEEIESCQVCALGACLLSATHFKNELQFSDVDIQGLSPFKSSRDTKVFSLLTQIFSPEELLLIEHCFEGYSYGADRVGKDLFNANNNYPDELIDRVYKFHNRYSMPTGRLTAIMNNIIKNKGKFILP